ncbi:MAG: TIGR03943 family protein [Caldilineaceae bacterium]|nr:TIGR03943 family protein [Caldilineaceae bacterium]
MLERRQIIFKSWLLVAMGFFLLSRIMNGTLYFYINKRFLGLTLFAVAALLAVGTNYYLLLQRNARGEANPEDGEMGYGHTCDDGCTGAHEHEHTPDHTHAHHLTWVGALLVMLPIALGLFVRPQPLGASAMDVREATLISDVGNGPALPGAVRAAQEKAANERNILEWDQTFRMTENPAAALAGEPVDVTGFVYQYEDLGTDQFLVMRYAVNCCAADAAAFALVVEWPDATALEDDMWVSVTGELMPGKVGGRTMPVVQGRVVELVDPPQQPYLYP